MIYTLTMNPAVDYFLTLNDHLLIDEVNRGSDERCKAGGKGLNVSKTLSVMGIRSKAIALLGGFTGKFIEQSFSKDPNIDMISIPVNGMNRINTKAHYDHKALCINGHGPTADKQVRKELRDILKEINPEDIVVISGSMMKGLDDEFLIELSECVHHQDAKLVIDMEQISVEVLKKCKPSLIKPNLYEYRLIMGDDSITAEDISIYLQRTGEEIAHSILVSLGAKGAVLKTQDKIYYLHQPATTLTNKVGAGDSMLAAYIGKMFQGCDVTEALQYAGAAGNAAASMMEDITMENIKNFLPLMSVSIEQIVIKEGREQC